MSSLVIGPVPEHLDLTVDRIARNDGAVAAVLAAATLLVGLRFWARNTNEGPGLAYDDWSVMIALIFAYGAGACCFLGGEYGIGKHIWAVPENDVLRKDSPRTVQMIFAYVVLYATTVPMVKISVLLLYRRIFRLTWTLYICVFLCIGYTISISTTISLACVPTSFFWTQWVDPRSGGHCRIDLYRFYLWNGMASLITDVIILCLPMPIIWGLQMPKSQRWAINGIFFLGGLVCAASIVRIWAITKVKDSIDVTWVISDAMIWSNVEPCMGIVSACLPTLRPLLRRRWSNIGSGRISRDYERQGELIPGSEPDSLMASANRSANRTVNTKWMAFRPAEDEIYLTTDVGRGSGLRDVASNASTGSLKIPRAMQIRVKRNIYWTEENG
ncbi:hypothetical protein BDV28DRAFT_163023 [Aspergillus coremiiformis]|uniref:Rhodopsin domain-containing protein n=1 Tax=Aspergillus coremiiformis TaxID=138285 RepID=A0A5N6ZGT2_9EURO|nr:hypothetical protein BDV28DRAFT_163023 [Aspergillus coremiiformis]